MLGARLFVCVLFGRGRVGFAILNFESLLSGKVHFSNIGDDPDRLSGC